MKKEKFVEEVNVDVDGVQVSSVLSPDGRFEYPDPVPVAPPVEFQDKTSDLVRRLVFGELKRLAEDNDFETFEEAEDFDIEDDPIDPLTPYEKYFEPKPSPSIPVSLENGSVAKVAGEGGPQPTGAPPTPAVKSDNSTST